MHCSYILIIIYTAIALWRFSRVYQKFHLTVASIVAIALGAGAAFGLVAAAGMNFNFTVQVWNTLIL